VFRTAHDICATLCIPPGRIIGHPSSGVARVNPYKPFFAFLLVLFVMCGGVAFYVFNIDSCAQQATVFPVMECYKLYMAFGVLFAVAMMLALGAGFYALVPPPPSGDHPGKQIFDTLSKTLLPVITLVLGYYFGSAQASVQTGPEQGEQMTAPSVQPADTEHAPAMGGR
jgi:hypothetical protein